MKPGFLPQLAGSGSLTERERFRSVYRFDWLRLKSAFEELDRRYPDSSRTLNFFCWFAWHYGDRATAAELVKRLAGQWTPDSAEVWRNPSGFEQVRRWLATP